MLENMALKTCQSSFQQDSYGGDAKLKGAALELIQMTAGNLAATIAKMKTQTQ